MFRTSLQVCALLFLSSLSGVGFAQTRSGASSVYVVTRLIPHGGNISPSLSEHDFKITSGRSTLPFENFARGAKGHGQPPLPTFVLVDMMSCSKSSSAELELTEQARKLPSYGWRVEILTAGGQERALSPLAWGAVPIRADMQSALENEETVVRKMGRLAGRHIIFKLCTRVNEVSPLLSSTATDVLAILYAISPGSKEAALVTRTQDSVVDPSSGLGSHSPTPTLTLGGTFLARAEPGDRPVAEPTINQAAKDAVADGRQYYGLRITQLTSLSEIKVSVRIPHPDPWGYKVETQAYSDGKTVPNVLVSVH